MYYVGLGTVLVGLVWFLFGFFHLAVNYAAIVELEHAVKTVVMTWGLGLVKIIVGGAMAFGAKRSAKTALASAPERSADEAKKPVKKRRPKQVIKIRCRDCKALNAEIAKYCDQCGKEV